MPDGSMILPHPDGRWPSTATSGCPVYRVGLMRCPVMLGDGLGIARLASMRGDVGRP